MAAVRSAVTACFVLVAMFTQQALCTRKHKVEALFQGRCDTPGSYCEQLCIDLPNGGYECACKDGYELFEDGFSCKETPTTPGPPTELEKDITNVDTNKADGLLNTEPKKAPKESVDFDELDSVQPDYPWEGLLRTNVKSYAKDYSLQGDDPAALDQDKTDNNELQQINPVDIGEREKKRNNRKHGRRRKHKTPHRQRNAGRQSSRLENRLKALTSSKGADVSRLRTRPGGDRAEQLANNIPDRTTPKTPPARVFHSCKEITCQAGGLCVPDKMRGGVRCQCKLGTDGEFCEKDVMVRFPKFLGTGYISFPPLRGAYQKFSISIEFRPDTQNGLILFSAEHTNARADFFSIALVDGYAEFRFDCGTGMGAMRTTNQVRRNEWNVIMVYRMDWDGWIKLNNGPQAKGRSRGLFSRITFRKDLFLGGYSNTTLIGERTGMKWGFVGCVRMLKVNGREYDMRKGAFVGDAIGGLDVGECSSKVCSRVKCLNGGTCIAESADNHVCLCPLGTAGDRCENRIYTPKAQNESAGIDILVPSFNGNSYLQFIGLRRTVLSFCDMEFIIKPTANTGLIFYNGYTTDKSGDFISLALINGYVEYRFDLGTGPAIIRSPTHITLNEWHVIRVSRTGRDGFLQIDNGAAVDGMAQGAYTQLTLTLDMFLGGHRNFDEVARNAGISTSFKGCIQKVVINDKTVRLMQDAVKGINVDNCNHPCAGQPCMNGGLCEPQKDFYICTCPLGFENTNCEDKIGEPIRVPMFFGRSFLEYTDPYILQRVKGDKIDIQMLVRGVLQAPDGLIFWVGEDEMTPSSDYLALGLNNGTIQLGFNLGSGEVIIRHHLMINDGRWHRIRAQRFKKVGYLEVDDMDIIEGTSPGNLQQLNTGQKLFLGGMDPYSMRYLKKYTDGFVGCISNLTLATDYHVDLVAEAVAGQNVNKCT